MASLPDQLKLGDWANLRLMLMWVYDGPPAKMHQSRGMTPGTTAWLMQAGRVQVHMGSNELAAEAGQWVLVPQGALHFDFSEDARILSVHYVAQWLSGRQLFEHDTPLVVSAEAHSPLTRVGWALHRFVARRFPDAGTRLLQETGDLASHLQLQALVQRWMLAVVRVMAALDRRPTPMQPMDHRVVEARRLIDSLIAVEPFIERTLPQRLGLSASHIDRLFLTELGVTPRAYAERCRLNWARHRLTNSDDLVKQIAMQLGFRQPSHFTHWFHKQTGVAPDAFRRAGPRK